jgi:toxin ParE1/3/4
VPQLVYRAVVRCDIDEIPPYIARESERRAVADTFIDKLTDYCEHIAKLPGLMGRARPELGRDYRSTTFDNYVIFLRYIVAGTDGFTTMTLVSRLTPPTGAMSRRKTKLSLSWSVALIAFAGLMNRSV